jgi:hypothetical protein
MMESGPFDCPILDLTMADYLVSNSEVGLASTSLEEVMTA